tara:strand:- start:8163 stop:8627 length:465 start_codon:yes stop_codon:yes gene_type:complete
MNSLLFYAVMQMLMANEGFRAEPYQIRDVWHIGYGYNLEARTPKPPCAKYKCLLWSKADAFYQLEQDVIRINSRLKLRYNCYKRLPLKGQIVMIDMAYNIGIDGLLKFKELMVSLCVKDYKAAGENILDSDYARIDVPNRARRNVKILAEGYFL